jgi:tryptophan 2,3-dioxygenase
MQHLNVAIKYIDHSGLGDGEATGGSDWKKYMHQSTNVEYFFLSCGQRKRLLMGK